MTCFSMLLFTQKLNAQQMKKKILFVVTSHDKKGKTGEPTGFYLGEVTHPWAVLHDAGRFGLRQVVHARLHHYSLVLVIGV